MPREISYTQAMTEALQEEMRRDETVFVLGEDVATTLPTRDVLEEFGPRRVRNTPISEVAIVGAALTGSRPVAEMMRVDFMAVAMDQIINQVAKIRYMFGGTARVPLVIQAACGGGRGSALAVAGGPVRAHPWPPCGDAFHALRRQGSTQGRDP